MKKSIATLTNKEARQALASIGKHIKYLRLSKGMTRKDVAKKAKIHPNTLVKIETQGTDMKLGTAIGIAYALGIRPGELWPVNL